MNDITNLSDDDLLDKLDEVSITGTSCFDPMDGQVDWDLIDIIRKELKSRLTRLRELEKETEFNNRRIDKLRVQVDKLKMKMGI